MRGCGGTDGGTQPGGREHDAQAKVAAQDRLGECPVRRSTRLPRVSALLEGNGPLGGVVLEVDRGAPCGADDAAVTVVRQPVVYDTEGCGEAYWGLRAGWASARARKSGGDWYGLRACIRARFRISLLVVVVVVVAACDCASSRWTSKGRRWALRVQTLSQG